MALKSSRQMNKINKNGIETNPLSTIATASFNTLSPNTNAYKFTSTFISVKMARIVKGSVGEIKAPKYNV